MCKKDSPRLRRRSTVNRKPTVTVKPARKTRSRTRKPKYLSLRLQLSPEKTQQSRKMTMATARSATTNHRHQQLNLFPLHPENLVEEKDTHDENMAYFFDSADGGATTLTTLFGARSSSSSSSSEEDNSTLSPSLTYAYGEQCSKEGALVRTAMRNKERDASEERWVCYSEVVERKDEEVTSCAGADGCLKNKSQNQRLSLKLDYEEILNAWSDKGSLYIQLESPQTVPDLSRDFFFHESSKGVQDGWGSSNVGLWTVPENSNFSSSGKLAKVKEEAVQLGGGGGEEWKVGQREASVLRYKEKRQNRLFSKRIRYEVRKINAEKRPRLKGRFVKRN